MTKDIRMASHGSGPVASGTAMLSQSVPASDPCARGYMQSADIYIYSKGFSSSAVSHLQPQSFRHRVMLRVARMTSIFPSV
jgi:hypothetical protein